MREDEEFASSPVATESKGAFLFFGCRRRAHDWLFKPQMDEFLASGTLTRLFTAFSRDQVRPHGTM